MPLRKLAPDEYIQESEQTAQVATAPPPTPSRLRKLSPDEYISEAAPPAPTAKEKLSAPRTPTRAEIEALPVVPSGRYAETTEKDKLGMDMGVAESFRRLPERYGISGKGVSDYVSAAANVINPMQSTAVLSESSKHAGQQGKDRATLYSDDELSQALYEQEGTVFDFGAKKNFQNLVKTDRKEAENMLNRSASERIKTKQNYEADAASGQTVLAGGVMGALDMPGYALGMAAPIVSIPMKVDANIRENAVPKLSLDADGDIVVTRESMDVMENLGKSTTGALLEYGIEKFGGKAISGATKGLAKVGKKALPSSIIEMADKMASGVTKYGTDFLESHPKAMTAADNWKRFGKWSQDTTGVGSLPEELSEEWLQAATDAAGNLKNEYDSAGLQNVPSALKEVAKQTPEILISMALFKSAGSLGTHVALGMDDKERQATLQSMGVDPQIVSKMSRGERADYLHEMADAQLSPEFLSEIDKLVADKKRTPTIKPDKPVDLLEPRTPVEAQGDAILQASTATPQANVPTATPEAAQAPLDMLATPKPPVEEGILDPDAPLGQQKEVLPPTTKYNKAEIDTLKKDYVDEWQDYLNLTDGDEQAAAAMIYEDTGESTQEPIKDWYNPTKEERLDNAADALGIQPEYQKINKTLRNPRREFQSDMTSGYRETGEDPTLNPNSITDSLREKLRERGETIHEPRRKIQQDMESGYADTGDTSTAPITDLIQDRPRDKMPEYPGSFLETEPESTSQKEPVRPYTRIKENLTALDSAKKQQRPSLIQSMVSEKDWNEAIQAAQGDSPKVTASVKQAAADMLTERMRALQARIDADSEIPDIIAPNKPKVYPPVQDPELEMPPMVNQGKQYRPLKPEKPLNQSPVSAAVEPPTQPTGVTQDGGQEVQDVRQGEVQLPQDAQRRQEGVLTPQPYRNPRVGRQTLTPPVASADIVTGEPEATPLSTVKESLPVATETPTTGQAQAQDNIPRNNLGLRTDIPSRNPDPLKVSTEELTDFVKGEDGRVAQKIEQALTPHVGAERAKQIASMTDAQLERLKLSPEADEALERAVVADSQADLDAHTQATFYKDVLPHVQNIEHEDTLDGIMQDLRWASTDSKLFTKPDTDANLFLMKAAIQRVNELGLSNTDFMDKVKKEFFRTYAKASRTPQGVVINRGDTEEMYESFVSKLRGVAEKQPKPTTTQKQLPQPSPSAPGVSPTPSVPIAPNTQTTNADDSPSARSEGAGGDLTSSTKATLEKPETRVIQKRSIEEISDVADQILSGIRRARTSSTISEKYRPGKIKAEQAELTEWINDYPEIEPKYREKIAEAMKPYDAKPKHKPIRKETKNVVPVKREKPTNETRSVKRTETKAQTKAEKPSPLESTKESREKQEKVTPYSKESIQESFNLTDEQATATDAIVQALGLDTTRIDVGGEGEGLSQGKKGMTRFVKDGKAIIKGFQSADVSTALHEVFHVARRQLFDRSIPVFERRGITYKDIDTLEQFAGVGKDGKWTAEAEEKAARAWERWLRNGKTANKNLNNAFQKIADWMGDIYRVIKGSAIDIQLTPEVEAVFEKMLTKSDMPLGKPRSVDTGKQDALFQATEAQRARVREALAKRKAENAAKEAKAAPPKPEEPKPAPKPTPKPKQTVAEKEAINEALRSGKAQFKGNKVVPKTPYTKIPMEESDPAQPGEAPKTYWTSMFASIDEAYKAMGFQDTVYGRNTTTVEDFYQKAFDDKKIESAIAKAQEINAARATGNMDTPITERDLGGMQLKARLLAKEIEKMDTRINEGKGKPEGYDDIAIDYISLLSAIAHTSSSSGRVMRMMQNQFDMADENIHAILARAKIKHGKSLTPEEKQWYEDTKSEIETTKTQEKMRDHEYGIQETNEAISAMKDRRRGSTKNFDTLNREDAAQKLKEVLEKGCLNG